MDKDKLEERIDDLEDSRYDIMFERVEEIHKILVVGNGEEPLIISVNKNTLRTKLILWLIGVIYTALITGCAAYAVKVF